MNSDHPFPKIDDEAEERAVFANFVSYLNTNGASGQMSTILATIDTSAALESFLLRNDDPKQRIFFPYVPGSS